MGSKLLKFKCIFMKRVILFFLMLIAARTGFAGEISGFADGLLQDRTLRVDYIFSGTATEAEIALDAMSVSDGWFGRRHNLSEVPVEGNGQICMVDARSGRVLYRYSFSTLFQEWQSTEEATMLRRSFENVFLLPMPSAEAVISIRLFDAKRRMSCEFSHKVNPEDILIRKTASRPAESKYIHQGGLPEDCIDVAIVAEGYTAAEKEMFYKDAAVAVDAIFSHAPFDDYKDRFNFVAVALESEDSGVSVPLEGEWKNTAISSHFSTFYMDRYLTTLNIKDLHDALSGIPYEHIIILANTETYGGGGIYNSYTLTTAHHPAFRPVVVHEFGHSFAALADEYYYDDMYSEYYYPGIEPWEQNITTLADFDGHKWSGLLPARITIPTPALKDIHSIWKEISDGAPMEKFIGIYEGAGYQSKGVYRAYPDCRMQTNKAEMFCPACRKAVSEMIEFYL